MGENRFAIALRTFSIHYLHVPKDQLDEFFIILTLCGPVVLTYLVGFLQAIVSQILVGHLGAAALASSTLANMFANALGNSIIIGTTSASDTLISQAFGARNFRRIGIITQRGIAVGFVLGIPIGLLWWNSDILLQALDQPPEVIELSHWYIRVLLAGVPAAIIFESIKKHFINIGLTTLPLLITFIGTVINLLAGYSLVYHSPLGVFGAPTGLVMGQWGMVIAIILYIKYHRSIHQFLQSIHLMSSTHILAIVDNEPKNNNEETGTKSTESIVAIANNATESIPNSSFAHDSKDHQSETNTLATAVESSVTDWEPLPLPSSNNANTLPVVLPSKKSVNITVTDSVPSSSRNDNDDVQVVTDIDALLDATFSDISLKNSFSGWWEYVSLGIPSAAMLFSEWASYEATSIIAGLLGTDTLAVHAVLVVTAGLSFMPILGISIGGSIRVGTRMGEREPDLAKLSYRVVLWMCLAYVTTNAIFILSVMNVWAYIFTNDPMVVKGVQSNLWILSIYTIFDAAQCVVSGVMRGLGKPSLAAMTNVLGYMVIGLPLGYGLALPLGCGLLGIWGAYCIAVFVVFILMFIISTRIDWKKASDVAFERAKNDGHKSNGGH